MSEIYVVKNQHGYYASKQKEWLDGREPRLLFRSPHKDEAINMVFEVSSKDINVRAEAILCELNDKNQPAVEVTVPLAEPVIIEPDNVDQNLQVGETENEAAIELSEPVPREETASERLSKLAARLRLQQETK